MPGRDGTGPLGMGTMTGRGAGFCAGYQQRVPPRAVCGGGYGRRNMYYATGLPYWARENVQTENSYGTLKENLERTLRIHEDAIGNIKKKLQELDKK